MIHTQLRAKKLVPFDAVWYPREGDEARVAQLGLPYTTVRQASPEFMRRYQRQHHAYRNRIIRASDSVTLTLDLRMDEDRLHGEVHTTRRARIRRGERLSPVMEVGSPSGMPHATALIDAFQQQLFGKPYEQQRWGVVERFGCVTQAVLDGQVIAAHAYLMDGKHRASLLLSATVNRANSALNTNTICNVNSLLQWQDIVHFQRLGFAQFDFYGLFNDPDHPSAGIDDFKLSFGGQKMWAHNLLMTPYAFTTQGLKAYDTRVRPLEF